jgi:glyoxylase-like metal-dependent hydrolase (beta-lactamase superfamily II)
MKSAIFGSFLFVSMAAAAAAQGNVYRFNLGSIEIFTLVENRGEGRRSILLENDAIILDQYIPGESYPSETNTFLIRNNGALTLVDTGMGSIPERLAELRIKPEDIGAILLTHLHGDHIGGLVKDGARVFPNAKLYVDREEYLYWTSKNPNEAVIAALKPYERFKIEIRGGSFDRPRLIQPGVQAIAAPGHTPGHTMYLVSSQGKQLLIAGDILHVEAIQFHLPRISVTYDSDSKAAAEARENVFKNIARRKIYLAGAHLLYPGIGSLEPLPEGGYNFIPVR